MAQNIYRDPDYESTVKCVGESSMFESNAHFLTFCAHYGVSLGKKKKLRKRGREINMMTFRPYLKDIFVIALSENQDIKILEDEDKCHDIFEQYTNAGLMEIHKRVNKNIVKDPNGVETITILLQELRNNITTVEDDSNLVLPAV